MTFFPPRRPLSFPLLLTSLVAWVALPSWATWNPSVLNVAWENDFTDIAKNEINVRTDSRLVPTAKGDGTTDDTAAIRAAVQLARSTGGGTVYFPAGDYRLVIPSDSTQANPLTIPSRVILRGDDPKTSRLFFNNDNAPVEGDGTWQWAGITFVTSSFVGMTDLGVWNVNPTQSSCALLWNRPPATYPRTKEIFFNNMDIHLAYGRWVWFENTDHFLFQKSMVDSTAFDQGPILFDGDTDMTVRETTVTYHYGRVELAHDQGGVISNNAFIRDAQNKDMDNGTSIESGGVEPSFSDNMQILDNFFQQNNTPPTEFGDGEALTSQHSTSQDVQDMGAVTGVSLKTLTDSHAPWDSKFTNQIPQTPSEVVVFISGRASGTWRTVTGLNTTTKTITVDAPFSPVPDVGDSYVITRWSLTNSLIQGNIFKNNPHGIPIWDGSYNVTVDNNTMYDSNNLLIRAADVGPTSYIEGRKWHQVAIHNKITNNHLYDTLNIRPSQLMLDTEAFDTSYSGMAFFDLQISGNHVAPNPSNPNAAEYWGQDPTQDGFYPCYTFGPAATASTPSVAFKNIYFWNNSLDTPVTYTAQNAAYASLACLNATSLMMAVPTLNLSSAQLSLGSSIQVTYSGGAPANHFEWQFFPISGGTPVEFTTTGTQANLASYQFPDTAYQISVEAIDAAGNRSTPATASITFSTSIPAPQINPNGGLFVGPQTVTLSTLFAQAAVYFTTDGSAATINSTPYQSPLLISADTVIHAISVLGSLTSAQASATFTIKPTLVITPASMSFSASQGTAFSEFQTLELSNPNSTAITWSAGGTTSGWLSMVPTSGSVPAHSKTTVTVWVNPKGVTSGMYHDAFALTSPGAAASFATVPVTLTIAPATDPLLEVSPAQMELSAGIGQSLPSQAFTISNAGGGTMAWTAFPSDGWIQVLPANGTLGSKASTDATLSFTTTGLSPGIYHAVAVLLSPASYVPYQILNIDLTYGTNSAATVTLAGVSSIRVYPNPWRRDKHAGKNMVFDQMAEGATVKLFTLSGRLMKTLTASNGSATWDLTNDRGEACASGLYLYVTRDPKGNTSAGKFAVVR